MSNPYAKRLEHETDCADIHARQSTGDTRLILLDVRATADWQQRRIPGSHSLPHAQITAEALDALARGLDVEFVTYCWGPHCNGATRGADHIVALGHSAREMIGGLWGWAQQGYRFEGEAVTLDIGILCFTGADLLDIGGPYEVFLTANRLLARRGEREVFRVLTIGESGPVYGGLGLSPQRRADDIQRLDVLVVPGAIAIDAVYPDQDLGTLAPRSEILASVCTGSFLLQRNGLLGEGAVTTHWEDVEALAHPDVRADTRWIDNGRVVTSGGLSSGIAMALHLVERLVDRSLAEATARQLDYVWEEHR